MADSGLTPNTGMPIITVQEFYPAVVDVSVGTSTVIYAKRALLRGVWINAALSAHTVALQDNGVTKFTIPASTPGGIWCPFGDVAFENDITAIYDAAATGSITAIYKAQV